MDNKKCKDYEQCGEFVDEKRSQNVEYCNGCLKQFACGASIEMELPMCKTII